VSPVLDLVRYRLQRETLAHDNPLINDAGVDLVALYDAGILLADMKDGELLLSLTDEAVEALQNQPLCELLAGLQEACADESGPLNDSPSR
jgi:hypothetical protein